MSIITLERCSKETALENTVRIIQSFRSATEFRLIYEKEKHPAHLSEFVLKQSDILNCEQHRFILADRTITDTINKASLRLGDVADVVTGFYTGDNKRFIRVLNESVKGSKNYDKVDISKVFPCMSLVGIESVPEGYVPYVKSASSTRYYRLVDEWFVRWDKDTINYYNSSKKTRFQNSFFYFKTGIAIPMVKSSSIKAFLLENRVFDQSIVGIFPKDNSRLYYILAIMNSNVVNNVIHTINPTANNSANYVKQIPYIEPEQQVINLISDKVKSIINNYQNGNSHENETIHSELNELIEHIYSYQL